LTVLFLVIFSSFSINPQVAFSQTVLQLPQVGTRLMVSEKFTPTHLSGITVHPNNPLKIDFLVNTGDSNLQGSELQRESQKLINYFMAALTVPKEQMWANLSPYEENRIIAPGLDQTELGRDMLVQDYILKQLTASLMYPEDEVGKKFWDRVYSQSQEKFGATDIPTDVFHKIWIVPDFKLLLGMNGSRDFDEEALG
jgi:hypothetical protein